jgi:hypothetical protein
VQQNAFDKNWPVAVESFSHHMAKAIKVEYVRVCACAMADKEITFDNGAVE